MASGVKTQQYDEVTRLYAAFQQSMAETDEAFAEFQRLEAQAKAAHDRYLAKTQAEHAARVAWMAAGDKVFAA